MNSPFQLSYWLGITASVNWNHLCWYWQQEIVLASLSALHLSEKSHPAPTFFWHFDLQFPTATITNWFSTREISILSWRDTELWHTMYLDTISKTKQELEREREKNKSNQKWNIQNSPAKLSSAEWIGCVSMHAEEFNSAADNWNWSTELAKPSISPYSDEKNFPQLLMFV